KRARKRLAATSTRDSNDCEWSFQMTQLDQLQNVLKRAADELPNAPLPDLDAAATTAGLLEVAYATLDSPVGTLLLAYTPGAPVPGCRQRPGRESAADRRALPPRPAHHRRAGRLHGRTRAQARAAGSRRRAC